MASTFYHKKMSDNQPWGGLLIFCLLISISSLTYGQKVKQLKKLSLEELMNLEVTLVSKQPQKLAEVASAIQIVTNEDVNRSTAARLPEALRLLPNLQVARVESSVSVISARGFNSIFANKLLVMIDGRSVYSPLFAGVFWDVQNVIMEDIEQIEAISGPGGTLWGMNAVNGVINIKTKDSENTQGLFTSLSMGDHLKNFSVRYGDELSDNFTYRVFAQRYDIGAFDTPGDEPKDGWNLTHAGFRVDGQPNLKDKLMFKGNLYQGNEYSQPDNSTVDGQNLLGRWTHSISDDSDFSFQFYIDRTWRRDIPSTISDEMFTYDFDFQHSFKAGKIHSFLWGLGYRYIYDKTFNSTTFVGLVPNNRSMPLYSSFIQDEISFFDDKFKITVGSKFQHNIYSGFEIQPSIRLAYTMSEAHTFWSAVSRAIRAPSRIDVDYYIPTTPVPPGTPTVNGGPDFVSEKLYAFEVGYRIQPSDNLLLSLASFYNQYDDLFSVDPLPKDTVRYRIQNNTIGTSIGVEFSGLYRLSPSLKLRGGYTYFHKDLKNTNGSRYNYNLLGNDPAHQFLLHSMLDLGENFQFDLTVRYVDEIKTAEVPSYFSLYARIAWLYKDLELSVNGRELLEKRHQEFGTYEVPRNYYVKLSLRLSKE